MCPSRSSQVLKLTVSTVDVALCRNQEHVTFIVFSLTSAVSAINDISISHGTFTLIRIRAKSIRTASWSTSFMENKLHCVLTISRKLSDTSSTRNSRVASSHQWPPAGGTQGPTSVPLTLQSKAPRATEGQCVAENLASDMGDLNSLYPKEPNSLSSFTALL